MLATLHFRSHHKCWSCQNLRRNKTTKGLHHPPILYTGFDRCCNNIRVAWNSLTLSNIKYQVWNTGLYVLNKTRAGATYLSALWPLTVKAETARACTQTRAATSQDKQRTGAASLAKWRRKRRGTECSSSYNYCWRTVWRNSLDAVAWSCQLSPQKWPLSQKPAMAHGSSAGKGRLQIMPAQDRKFAVPKAHRAVHSLYPNISISANNFSWGKWVIHKYISSQEKKISHTLNTLTHLQLTLLNNKI